MAPQVRNYGRAQFRFDSYRIGRRRLGFRLGPEKTGKGRIVRPLNSVTNTFDRSGETDRLVPDRMRLF